VAAAAHGDSPELHFSLPSAPMGASVVPETGVFTWAPSEGYEPGAYWVTVRVSNGGVPAQGVSQSFMVTVMPRPQLAVLAPNGESVSLTWTTQPGQRYQIQYKDDLNAADWNDLPEEVITSEGVGWMTHIAPMTNQRFYRLAWLP
jgi:hypothetical protein